MSKGIIVVDVPECCKCCKYCTGIRCAYRAIWCTMKNEPLTNDLKTKPDWCPIKPLPEKYSVNYMMDDVDIDVAIGRNACIDEILGGVVNET